MRRIFFAACMTLIFSGCNRDAEAAKSMMRSILKDPDSATWRNIETPGGGLVCGEVNSKNGTGGYSGFRKFMVKDDQLFFSEDEITAIQISGCCLTSMLRIAPEPDGHQFTDAEVAGQCEGLHPAL